MDTKNIYNSSVLNKQEEVIEEILSTKSFRLEKISSFGHRTPDNEWYDQDNDEWVLLLKGRATILFQIQNKTVNLKEGDYFLIKKHIKHRVEYVSEDALWLCIHFK